MSSSIGNPNNNLILFWLLRVIFPDTTSSLNKWYQLGNVDAYTVNTRGFKLFKSEYNHFYASSSFTVINESIFNMLSSEGHLIYTYGNVDESQNNCAEWRSYTKIKPQPTEKKTKPKKKRIHMVYLIT